MAGVPKAQAGFSSIYTRSFELTALANLIAAHFAKRDNEISSLVKSLIYNKADIHPDYSEGKLAVTICSTASQR